MRRKSEKNRRGPLLVDFSRQKEAAVKVLKLSDKVKRCRNY